MTIHDLYTVAMYSWIHFTLYQSYSHYRQQNFAEYFIAFSGYLTSKVVRENSRYFAKPPVMTPEECLQKFHTEDGSLSRSAKCFWLVVPWQKFALTNQKPYPDLGIDASSVWNFSSDIVAQASFCGETSGSGAICQRFSQCILKVITQNWLSYLYDLLELPSEEGWSQTCQDHWQTPVKSSNKV